MGSVTRKTDLLRASFILLIYVMLIAAAVDSAFAYTDLTECSRLRTAGETAVKMGQYAEAAKNFSLAVDEAEKANHLPEIMRNLNLLADTYDAAGEFEQEEKVLRRLIKVHQDRGRFSSVAGCFKRLGNFYLRHKKYTEAESAYESAVEVWRGPQGSPQGLARSVEDLAEYYASQKDYIKAEVRYKQSLEILEGIYGKKSVLLKRTLSKLAALYQLEGRTSEASKLTRQIRISTDRDKNEYHRFTKDAEKNAVAAIAKMRISDSEQENGKNSPEVADTMEQMANLYAKDGQLDEAVRLYQRILAIRKEAFGEGSESVAKTFSDLAVLYISGEKLQDAETSLTAAIRIRDTAGEREPGNLKDLELLSSVYVSRGEYAQAEPLLKRLLEIKMKKFGQRSKELENDLKRYAAMLRKQNRIDEAITVEDRLKGLSKPGDPPH